MRLLILGGGVFLGAALLGVALQRGHTVSVLNRGHSRTDWPGGVEVLTGDRNADLPGLVKGAPQRWNAVIDTCGYTPQDVQISATALQGCEHYLFVSSISAYAGFVRAPVREADPLASAKGVDPADRNPQHYGAQKAACEAEVTARFGAHALIVRPGLIVGPGDPTGRFSYWPWRVLAGGDVLVPAIDGAAPLQFIDVRDLAEWMLHLLEQRCAGVLNATGPAGGAASDWNTLLQSCVDAAAARGAPATQFVSIAERFLIDQGVQPWSELPLWVPSADANSAAFMRVSLQRAEAHGLKTRPLQQTVAAVLDEGRPASGDKRCKDRLDRQRESELIAAWRADVAA